MLATMGVAASTANAADLGDTVTVKAGSTSVTGKYGETLSKIDGSGFSAGITDPSVKFVGWYDTKDGNEPVDFTASLHDDVTLEAETVAAADATTVNFTGATPHFPDSSTTGTSITVDKKAGVVPSTRLPFYYQKAVVSWDVTYTPSASTNALTYNVPAADAAADGLELKGDAASYTVKPNLAGDTSVVKFDPQTLTNVSGVADWDTSATGAELQVPVAKGYAPVKAPEVVYTANPADVSGAKVYTQWVNAKGDVIKIGDAIPEDAEGTFKLDESSVSTSERVKVTFDLNGGKSDITNPQYVNKGAAVAKPADPTRDGYVFQGWKSGDPSLDTADGFYAFDSKLAGDITLQAQWAKTTDIKVTFSAGNFAGAGDDKTVTVKGDAFVDESQAPKFTREGFYYTQWAYDKDGDGNPDTYTVTDHGVSHTYTSFFDFTTTLAGAANDGKNFTLVPVWERADENQAKAALNYVTLGTDDLKDSNHVTDNADDSGYFTDASWDEFVKAYTAQYQKYVAAKYVNGSENTNEVDAKTSAEIVSALSDAWKGLRFRSDRADTVLDGKTDTNGGTNTAVVVRRLAKGSAQHLLTGDENEVKSLTSKLDNASGWTLDATTFRTVDNINADKAASLRHAEWVANEKANTDLGFTPLLKQVSRLYNTREHLYTSDAVEIGALLER
ncbi:hypothetical protein COO72_12430, partial [Bifidobacterium callitrichos]